MHRSHRLFSAPLARQGLASKPIPKSSFASKLRYSTSRTVEAPSSPSRVGSLAAAAISSALAGYFAASLYNPSSPSVDTLVNPIYATKAKIQEAIKELEGLFPEGGVSTLDDVLKSHGFSINSYHPSAPHSVVVFAHSTEDVVKVVKIANKYLIPVTAFSGGTSLEGHYGGTPEVGGICIDMSGMDSIIHINEADSDMVVQSGVKWEDINATLEEKGIPLFFPLDPGPGATIGGMIGTGCSGTNAVRYGTAKAEWFLNVTVVLPSGEVIKTRRRARKSSAGFDTTKLFIGAEGTLGIVTEATLRLAPRLPTTVATVAFPDVRKAVDAVAEIVNAGVPIQCVELLDDHMMHALNVAGLADRKYPELDSLFFKFQGSKDTQREASATVKKIVEKHGGKGFQAARDEKEAHDFWQNRKYALWSTMALYPDSRVWTTDVAVPVSRLPELVLQTKEDLAQSGLKSTIVGHVGDGNFHAFMIIRNEQEMEPVKEAVHRLVHRALALDGTCTGEHGVGVGKKEYLIEELGPGTVELMRTVKRAIDPHNLFNPGKLYPDVEVKPNKEH
ncbi:FAD-binding domain protein [Ceratobasidium sp. AG-Ba]|nr:FAD-binding domain protein [Ceratobasidium sp. AG-Ba]